MLEGEAKKFAVEFSAKQAGTPSAAWKTLLTARPEAVLWVAYSTKNAGLQAKFKSFYTDWPQARQKIPYLQMQEMRIVPSIAGYDELVEKIFFELMDGKLGTVEEMKVFLEPYSPPAPPPPVHLRRARAVKKEAKVPKSRKKAAVVGVAAEGLEPEAGDVTDAATAIAPAKAGTEKAKSGTAAPVKAAPMKVAVAAKAVVPAKAVAKTAIPAKKAVSAKVVAKKAHPARPAAKKAVAAKAAGKPAGKKVAAKKVVAKAPAKKTLAKPVGNKAPAKTAAKGGAKAAVKSKAKVVVKAAAKTSKKAPAKSSVKKKR